jgi:hypothetical protein
MTEPTTKSTELENPKGIIIPSKRKLEPEKQSKESQDKDSIFKESPGNDNIILKAVSNIKLLIRPEPEVSTFVPSARMMYFVLHEMDQLLMQNRYWGSKLPRWCPLHDRLYYGILFYIQTFRCMRASGILPGTLHRFLNTFEESYPPESLVIAGPLIVFFKALTVCSPPFTEYGMVSPAVPHVPGTTPANSHSLDYSVKVLLPNLTALFRGVANMRRPPVSNVPIEWTHNLANPAGGSVPIAHNAANEQSRDCLVTPGTMYDINWNNRQKLNYQQEPSSIKFPSMPHSSRMNSWPEYLGLDANHQWFSDLLGQMVTHSNHFSGGSTLAKLSPLNGTAGLIQVIGTGTYTNRNDHRDAIRPQSLYAGQAEVTTTEITPPNDQVALFTQINYVPPPNFHPTDDDTGLVGATLFGPWWKVSPTRMYSNEYDPSLLVPQVLAQYLHLDHPEKRL